MYEALQSSSFNLLSNLTILVAGISTRRGAKTTTTRHKLTLTGTGT